MKQLVEQVKQWGIARGLDKVGHLAQAEYTLKETAELLDAYADKDLPKINDAIGDILVTLIVGASNDDNCYRATKDLLSNHRIKFARTPSKSDELFGHSYSRLLNNVMQLEFLCEDDRMTSGTYACCIDELNSVLKSVNFTFSQSLSLQDCLQLAYNEIKNRTGKVVNGQFIKDK